MHCTKWGVKRSEVKVFLFFIKFKRLYCTKFNIILQSLCLDIWNLSNPKWSSLFGLNSNFKIPLTVFGVSVLKLKHVCHLVFIVTLGHEYFLYVYLVVPNSLQLRELAQPDAPNIRNSLWDTSPSCSGVSLRVWQKVDRDREWKVVYTVWIATLWQQPPLLSLLLPSTTEPPTKR